MADWEKVKVTLVSSFIFLTFLGCGENQKLVNQFSYELENPAEIYPMPVELDEISGIFWLNDSIITGVEDNEGKIYYYNINQKRVQQTIDFKKKGDFEDLVKVDSLFYVILSDGTIYQVLESGEVEIFKNNLSQENDVEGLCYDYKNNQLLLALKGRSHNSPKSCREIYAFDLKSKQLSKKAVYTICSKDFEALGNKKIKFRPSCLAIHPVSGQVYIISAAASAILRMKPDGTIIDLANLNTNIFNQPEGITFSPDGTMYISNEGKFGTANIIKLSLKE